LTNSFPKEQVIRYRYDSMNRLLEERYDDAPIRYVYDQCGNRLEKVDTDGKEEYNYNCKNQLISRKNRTEAIIYQYDLQGNVLEEAGRHGKTEYRYNAFNQQTAVLMNDGQIQENQYDAESLRAGVTENGQILFFVKHFSLKKAFEFPVFIKGFSLLLAGNIYASLRMSACSMR